MTKFSKVILIFSAISCVWCIQKCISDGIFLQSENNVSIINDPNASLLIIDETDSVITVKNLNQSDNRKYNFVPEISNYERGNLFMKSLKGQPFKNKE